MKRFFKRLATACTLPVLAGTATVHAGFDLLNMPRGVTPISKDVYDLHMIILIICAVIGVIVFGVMFYSILRHRKSAGYQAKQFHHSTKAEIIWTVVPCLILVFMAYPATQALIKIEDSTREDMTIKVTGYQWAWHYEYLDSGVDFYSRLSQESRGAIYNDPHSVQNYLLDVDNPVVVPVGKKVRLVLTSNDVIHAWWVPALGMKRDAIPGFVNELWFLVEEAGTYRGQCAELCGRDHGFMPIVVVAKPQAEYETWVAEQQKAATDAPGKSAAILQPDGKSLPTASGQALTNTADRKS